jgi:hypothetical protein
VLVVSIWRWTEMSALEQDIGLSRQLAVNPSSVSRGGQIATGICLLLPGLTASIIPEAQSLGIAF